MTDWKPGDVANSHVLGHDMVWRPLGESGTASAAAPPPPPGQSYPADNVPKQTRHWKAPTFIGIGAFLLGLLVGAGLASGGNSGGSSDEQELNARRAQVVELEKTIERDAKKDVKKGII